MSSALIVEEKKWEESEVKGKRKAPENPQIKRETPKKAFRIDEDIAFRAPEKIRSDVVIPLAQFLIEGILEHRDPNKIDSITVDIIGKCLEQMVTKDVPIDILVEHKIGLLLKDFYDFLRLHPQLELLEVVTRCAFNRLKSRTGEVLLGEKKVLRYGTEDAGDNKPSIIPLAKDVEYNAVEIDEDQIKGLPLLGIPNTIVNRMKAIRKSKHSYGLRPRVEKQKKHSILYKKNAKEKVKKAKKEEVEEIKIDTETKSKYKKMKKAEGRVASNIRSEHKDIADKLNTLLQSKLPKGKNSPFAA